MDASCSINYKYFIKIRHNTTINEVLSISTVLCYMFRISVSHHQENTQLMCSEAIELSTTALNFIVRNSIA
jgi:hypothetical protein